MSSEAELNAGNLNISIEAEGGADSWARPPPPKINETRDSIGESAPALPPFFKKIQLLHIPVFQQIDVETASNSDGTIILRMFGVTQVRQLRVIITVFSQLDSSGREQCTRHNHRLFAIFLCSGTPWIHE